MKKIGLAYAMKGEIESILRNTGATLLETVCGVEIYEIEEGIYAYTGGVGKVNAAMSTQLFIDRIVADPMFPLSREEIEEQMAPEKYVGRAPSQVVEFINEEVAPMLERYPDEGIKTELKV